MSTPIVGPLYIERDGAIGFGGPQEPGFVLYPYAEVGRNYGGITRQRPHIIGDIPNLQEFSEGPDLFGNARLLKRPGEPLFVPKIFAPFVPFVQMGINREVSINGGDAYDAMYVTLRPSRHQPVKGVAHQPLFGDMHSHAANGPSSYYAASDVAPTEFPNLTARNGQIVRFEEMDLHRSPTTEELRTFAILVCYRNMPDIRNRYQTHRYPPDGAQPERTGEWEQNAVRLLGDTYSPTQQVADISRWHISDQISGNTANGAPQVFAYLTPMNFAPFSAIISCKGRELGASVEPLLDRNQAPHSAYDRFVRISTPHGTAEQLMRLVGEHSHYCDIVRRDGNRPIFSADVHELLAMTGAPYRSAAQYRQHRSTDSELVK